MKKQHLIGIVFGVLVFIALYVYIEDAQTSEKTSTATSTASSKAKGYTYDFTCKDNRSITATFYPSDDRQADLVLSDGRTMTLIHAPAADGARYINLEESIVFWNKGTTAFLEENKITTYRDCVTSTKYPELEGDYSQPVINVKIN